MELWRELPTKQFFSGTILSWNTVFYHYNKWAKSGCWAKIWINILKENRKYLDFLDLSSVEFDSSHIPAKNGGDAVGYQGTRQLMLYLYLIIKALYSQCPPHKKEIIMTFLKYSHSLVKFVPY